MQPLDTHVNKSIKDKIRNKFDVWYENYGLQDNNKTKAGYFKPPNADLIINWVLKSWQEIDSRIIINSFQHCGNFFYFLIIKGSMSIPMKLTLLMKS